MLKCFLITLTFLYVAAAFKTPATVEEFKEVLRSFNNFEETKRLIKKSDTLVYASVDFPNDFNPISKLIEYYENYVLSQNYTKILEIGPGVRPFKYATHSIDYFPSNMKNNSNILHFKLDLDTDKFPFEDKYFDFVFCRYVLQDLNHPVHAYNEMTRVGKNGFIETPSPLAESLKYNIYSGDGYHGHPQSRFMFFTDIVGNVLYAIPKLPSIEFISPSIFGTPEIEAVAAYIVENMKYSWNNYYSWNADQNPTNPSGYNPLAMIKVGIDFSVFNLHTTGEYATLIRLAICNALDSSAVYGG